MTALGITPGPGAYKLLLEVASWAAVRGGSDVAYALRVLGRMQEEEVEVCGQHYECIMRLAAHAAMCGRAVFAEGKQVMSMVASDGLQVSREMLDACIRLASVTALRWGGGAEEGLRELVVDVREACHAMRGTQEGPPDKDDYGRAFDVVRVAATRGVAGLQDAMLLFDDLVEDGVRARAPLHAAAVVVAVPFASMLGAGISVLVTWVSLCCAGAAGHLVLQLHAACGVRLLPGASAL